MILVMVHVSYLENLFHFVLEKTHFKNMTFINTPSKRKEKKVKRRTEQTFVLVLTFPKICYNFLEAFLIIIHDQNAQTNRRIIESSITFRQHGLTFFSFYPSLKNQLLTEDILLKTIDIVYV